MKLFRFGQPGHEKPGVLLLDDAAVDTSSLVPDYDEPFFGSDGLDRLRQWNDTAASAAPKVPTAVRIGPPVARPSKIIGIGLNYRDHAEEAGMSLPSEPVFFLKASSALAAPNDDLAMPPGATKLDWEVELALVIGRAARRVGEKEAMDHVAGFAILNDVSERGDQLDRGGQWTKGKSADGFAPFGPYLVTTDELGDGDNLSLFLKVNGETMQDGNTANMAFKVPKLVSYVSHFMTLLPGDIITTGTPAGVGLGKKPPVFLKPGDVVELSVEGLGTQRQKVVAEK